MEPKIAEAIACIKDARGGICSGHYTQAAKWLDKALRLLSPPRYTVSDLTVGGGCVVYDQGERIATFLRKEAAESYAAHMNAMGESK